MNTEMIRIYGNEHDVGNIRRLIDGCVKELSVNIRPMSVFLDNADVSDLMLSRDEYAVIRAEDRDRLPEKVRAMNYSIGDLSADVCALNVQPRENGSSFEILYENFMGRIFLPNDTDITQLQILVSVTVMFFMDADCDKVLRVMNELLR